MTEERLKELEASFYRLPGILINHFDCVVSIPDLIAEVRRLQKPLAEQLEPTIDILEKCKVRLDIYSDPLPCMVMDEIARLSTLAGREK